MPRVCAICSHKRRLEIDRAVVQGRAISKIALEFGVPEWSVRAHAENHLSRQLLKADEIRSALDSQSLAREMTDLVDRTKRILDSSEADGQRAVSLAAIRELRASYEFMVKLSMTLHQMRQEQQQQEALSGGATLRGALETLDPMGMKLLRLLTRHLEGHSVETGLRILFSDCGLDYRPTSSSPEASVAPFHQEQPKPPEYQQQPVDSPSEHGQVPRRRTNPAPSLVHPAPGGGRFIFGPPQPTDLDPGSEQAHKEREEAKRVHERLCGSYRLERIPG